MQKAWLQNVALKTVPLRDFGTVDPALTSLVRYLIHDSSEYVSGNIFIVEAGTTLAGFPIFSSLWVFIEKVGLYSLPWNQLKELKEQVFMLKVIKKLFRGVLLFDICSFFLFSSHVLTLKNAAAENREYILCLLFFMKWRDFFSYRLVAAFWPEVFYLHSH